MNSIHYAPNGPRPIVRILWIVIPLAFLLAFALVVIGIIGFFRLSRDTRVLRDSLRQSTEFQAASWDEKIELRAGAVTCWGLRTGLSFAPLDREAQMALRSIRGAEVGVYELDTDSGLLDRVEMLRAADKAMSRRGWERIVGIAKKRELVAIYVPTKPATDDRIRTCLAVVHDRQLVVASAHGDLEALIELVQGRPEWIEPRRALPLALAR